VVSIHIDSNYNGSDWQLKPSICYISVTRNQQLQQLQRLASVEARTAKAI